MPDFDIDFAKNVNMSNFMYVQNIDERVGQIITLEGKSKPLSKMCLNCQITTLWCTELFNRIGTL
jgi:hypothetical protein